MLHETIFNATLSAMMTGLISVVRGAFSYDAALRVNGGAVIRTNSNKTAGF